MRRITLGTAGHIDHGKTLLTKALTGIDTDRLAEEKSRGISIELGFAPMRLSDGTELSLIDVPGHERFVRTMIAGVSGIDGVLFVIAADDGVMPQTREHLDILRLLSVRSGIVVLTKADLVSSERLQSVMGELRDFLRGSFLENAPICPVSAATGFGMDALRAQIEALTAQIRERDTERPFRMAADRVFPVSGFGAVASGTVTEGSVRVGDTVELFPQGITGTVRSLQIHGADAETARAGMRAALSFSGLPKDSLRRGCVLAQPDSMLRASQLTVRLELLADCPYRIRNGSQLHFYHETDEALCRLRLLDADELCAGGSGFAQLFLSEPVAVRWNDRFLLRFFSPVVTVGGGKILDCGDARLRRNRPEVLSRLSALASGDPSVSLLRRLRDGGLSPLPCAQLRSFGSCSDREFTEAVQPLLKDGSALALPDGSLYAGSVLSEKEAELRAALDAFHREYPLQPGMRTAEWNSRFFPGAEETGSRLLAFWTERGALCAQGGFISLPGFAPIFTQEHKIMQRRLLHYFREAWLFAPELGAVLEKFQRFGTLFEQTLANMRMNGLLIPLSPRYWVHFEANREALRIFSELAGGGKAVTLAEFRTAAGISRKYAQLFLEYWDRKGITRRVGDAHILLRTEPAPSGSEPQDAIPV